MKYDFFLLPFNITNPFFKTHIAFILSIKHIIELKINLNFR